MEMCKHAIMQKSYINGSLYQSSMRTTLPVLPLQRATLNSSKNHVSLCQLMHLIAFEKYFTVNSPDSIAEYSKLQQQKFVILYALFVEKYREQQDKKTNFFEFI